LAVVVDLLKEMSIDNIIENFKKKYENENPLHYIRSIAYFDDVTSDSWKSIKMISERMSSKAVKNTLVKNVIDYERRMFNTNNNNCNNNGRRK
jgi:RNase H-fold protein (predicted Holliday junction resolvase)